MRSTGRLWHAASGAPPSNAFVLQFTTLGATIVSFRACTERELSMQLEKTERFTRAQEQAVVSAGNLPRRMLKSSLMHSPIAWPCQGEAAVLDRRIEVSHVGNGLS
jgi:hypothetical protein